MMAMVNDLTKGDIHKKLWLFSIPMLISVMFQQIYNIADSMIAGIFAGEDALAAVGASYPITMLFMAVAIGSNTGCSVVISQLFGGKNYKDMKTAVNTTFLVCIVFSILLTMIGFIFCSPLMKLIHTPDNIFFDGKLYLNIYIAGFLFLFLYNVCTGVFNALGDSRTPLCFLIFSSIGNIILDLIFVAVFHWGVAGVAWATFLAQGISGIFSFFTLQKKLREIKIEGKPEKYSFKMLIRIARIAIPSILQQSFVSIGNMFIQTYVNSFGSAAIAGYSAAIKLNTFAITSFTTLANGLSSFAAQNIGARKMGRVKKGLFSGLGLALTVAIPFFLLYFFFGDMMMALFLKVSEAEKAAKIGEEFLKIVSPCYFIAAIKLMCDGLLRGAGMMAGFMSSTFTDLLLRVVLAGFLSGSFIKGIGYNITGIWMAWPVGWGISMVIAIIFTFYLISLSKFPTS